MKIVRTSIPFLPPTGYKAITIGCFIFTRRNTQITQETLRHEGVHWEQEKELLIIGFYLLYVLEFAVRLLVYRNWHTAYRAISFEREARSCDERKRYGWVRYLL